VEWKCRAFDLTRLWFVGPTLAAPRRIYLTVNFRRISREQRTDIRRRAHKPVDVYALRRQRPADVNVCPPQMLFNNRPHDHAFQILLRKPIFLKVSGRLTAHLQTSIMRGIGAGTRIFELLDRTPAIQPGEGMVLDPARSGPLRFENITFSYPTRRGVNVLENFDLEVNVGENVAVVYVLPS
jgi:hypothetical protein